MIKASELRIGCLVLDQHGDVVFVKKISDELLDLQFEDMIMEAIDISNCDPILLTSEWLERMGFRQTGDGVFGNAVIGLFFYEGEGNLYCAKFRYVHQLQNLYFALTGEELQIKDHAESK